MEESLNAITRVARFLREAERCRQHYLPLIAQGVGWAFALLLASALAAAAKPSAYLLAAAAAGYAAVSYLVYPRSIPADRRSYWPITVLLVILLLLNPIRSVSSALGGKELAVLALPTLRRMGRSIRRLRHLVLLPLALLVLATSAIIAGLRAAGVELLAASELALVAAATRRMIECGDEAARQLARSVEEETSSEPY